MKTINHLLSPLMSYKIVLFQDYLSKMFLARKIMVFSYKINNSGLPNILEFTTIDQ